MNRLNLTALALLTLPLAACATPTANISLVRAGMAATRAPNPAGSTRGRVDALALAATTALSMGDRFSPQARRRPDRNRLFENLRAANAANSPGKRGQFRPMPAWPVTTVTPFPHGEGMP